MNTLIKAKRNHTFRLQLAVNIRATVRRHRADGTTSMSLGCLLQTTPRPTVLAGAPLGTNAQYYYAEMFSEVARAIVPNFIY